MNTNNSESLAIRVKAFRLKQGFTQSELGERSKITQQHIAAIEGGKMDMRDSTIRRIAAALGVSPGRLYEGPIKVSRKGSKKVAAEGLEKV